MPLIRPSDASGDILPVSSRRCLVSGAEAVAKHALYRLKLLRGEWWENLDRGCQILRMLQTGRLTAADEPALSAYFSAYLLETEGVFALEEVSARAEGGAFRFSCRLVTAEGSAGLSLTLNDF